MRSLGGYRLVLPSAGPGGRLAWPDKLKQGAKSLWEKNGPTAWEGHTNELAFLDLGEYFHEVSATYRNPPLVEAVFEFAPAESTFNDDSLTHINGKLDSKYSGRKDVQKPIAFGIEYSAGSIKQLPPQVTVERHRRWNTDESGLVQFSAELCVFNVLLKYTHFVDYLPAMRELHCAYLEACSPKGTKFLGQRYINRVVLPSAHVDAADYFTFYPAGLSLKGHTGFSLTIVTKDLEGEGAGNVTLRLVYEGLDNERPAYFLEIYARSIDHPPYPFEWDAARRWHEKAHQGIEEAFESSLTPSCKAMLGIETP